jgi:hypothetical protein
MIMVKGHVSLVSTYKGNPDAKMVVEINEPEKQNAMALDKREVVIMGATEFFKLAEAIPDGILDKFVGVPKSDDDFGKEK